LLPNQPNSDNSINSRPKEEPQEKIRLFIILKNHQYDLKKRKEQCMIKSQELMKDKLKTLINNQEGKFIFLIRKDKNKLKFLKDLTAE